MRPVILTCLSLMSATWILAPLGAAAQPAPKPGCDGGPYRDFDFWVGVWDVQTPDGKTAGVNRIDREEGGCLIVERWTGAGGGTGQSYNFYDTATQKWRQIWVSTTFTIDYSGGLNDDGEMFLEGTIAYRNGVTAPFRGTWSPLADGQIRQHFEQADSKTNEWRPWFTGMYRRFKE